jgi:MFS family permease
MKENIPEPNLRDSRISFISAGLILVLTTVSTRSTNNMLVTTLPILSKYVLGFPNVLIGTLSATGYVATFLATSYFNPRLGSRMRRKMFIVSNVMVSLSLVLYYFANEITIWPVSVAVGFAFGIIFPNIITSATLHKDHIVQMSLLAIYSVSLSLSLVVGPLLETYLLSIIAPREIFLAFLSLSLMGLAISPLVKFPSIRKERSGRTTLKNSGLVASLLSITIYNVPFAAITSFLVLFAVYKFDVTRDVAYSVFVYFFIVSFATRTYMAIRPFRSIRFPLLGSAIVTVAGLSVLPFVHNFTLFVIVMAILGIPHGSIFPMSTIIIARGTKPEERNAANSYFLAYNNILFIAVPIVFGYLSTIIGYEVSFMLLAASAAFSTVSLIRKFRSSSEIFSILEPATHTSKND